MERAETRVLEGYCEKHHVVPRCLDKTSKHTVKLTPEEHYVAHQLLIRIYPNNGKLVYAAVRMTQGVPSNRRHSNKMYGWLRREWMKVIKQPWSEARRAAQTSEVNEKIASAKRGKVPYNKGKRIPEEQRKSYRRIIDMFLKPYFLDILCLLLSRKISKRASITAAKRWDNVTLAERNRQQKILNDALDTQQREALRDKYAGAAKTGWKTLRFNTSPAQLSEQRRAAALASHAARRPKRTYLLEVSFWYILQTLAKINIGQRRDMMVARNKSDNMRAKVSEAKVLFYANNPNASKPLADRNRQRAADAQLLSPELKIRKEIMRLEKSIAKLRAQDSKEGVA